MKHKADKDPLAPPCGMPECLSCSPGTGAGWDCREAEREEERLVALLADPEVRREWRRGD